MIKTQVAFERRIKKLHLILLAVISTASLETTKIALAETINSSAELIHNNAAMAYVFSRPMLGIMYQHGIALDKKFGLKSDCTSKYFVKPYSVVLIKPMEFLEGKQHPTRGMWISRYQLERCGDTKFYNALFVANQDGTAPMSRTYHPGNTNAGPILVQDALKSAIITAAAGADLQDCKSADVYDMQVTEEPHDVVEEGERYKGVWRELWTLNLCGKMRDVVMTFLPKGEGQGISFMASQPQQEDSKTKP